MMARCRSPSFLSMERTCLKRSTASSRWPSTASMRPAIFSRLAFTRFSSPTMPMTVSSFSMSTLTVLLRPRASSASVSAVSGSSAGAAVSTFGGRPRQPGRPGQQVLDRPARVRHEGRDLLEGLARAEEEAEVDAPRGRRDP